MLSRTVGPRIGSRHYAAPVEPLTAIASVRRAAAAADGQDPLDEAAELQLKHRGLEGIQVWLADDRGFALRRGTEVDLAVAPDARGGGLGTGLAEQALEGAGPVTAWSHGDHPAARAIAARHGLARARELWVMRRSADLALPELLLPADLEIRSFRTGDEEAVLRVNAAAFAHHPEQGDLDAAGLAERMAEPWFEPAGLLLAEDADGTVLGFHWTKRHDQHQGEVYVVGVDPAAQGRGLGRLLTLAGLHHLEAAGVAEVLLYVESDNRPAVHVYDGLGFTHADRDTHVQYQRPASDT
jgi:mycothiol synthase